MVHMWSIVVCVPVTLFCQVGAPSSVLVTDCEPVVKRPECMAVSEWDVNTLAGVLPTCSVTAPPAR